MFLELRRYLTLVVLIGLCLPIPARTLAAEAKPALTVDLVKAEARSWPLTISATGNVVPWQEALIGAEVGGQRLLDVTVDVGQRVRKGQLLARINADNAEAEASQAEAAVREAEAMLSEARANAQRARSLRDKGFYSPQTGSQFLTAEQTAEARANAARAALDAVRLRLTQTRIVAPDDGIISARLATPGSFTQPGQELFRLIRHGRLEWRAEVPEAQLARLRSGMAASLVTSAGNALKGRVRSIAPTVDLRTRNGIAYIDVLDPGNEVRAGMFVRGEIVIGSAPAQTLPQSALVLRDGAAFAYVASGSGELRQVKAVRVGTGRRNGERVEILEGLPADAMVVARGASFLADGDSVRIAPAGK